MISERSYYENSKLWNTENFGAADKERFTILATKLPPNTGSLLDVGCGNGLFLKYISRLRDRQFERLCGVDRSNAALAFVEYQKIQCSIDSLPFLTESFDAVTCMEVLEHLPQQTYISALNELSRVAKQFIIITVPYKESIRSSLTECIMCSCHFHPNYHLRSFNEQSLALLFQNTQFFCRELFYIYRQKIIPPAFKSFVRFILLIKRSVLHQPRLLMPPYTICPACGYVNDVQSNQNSALTNNTINLFIKTHIHRLLRFSYTWRWIGAIYERS